MQSDSGFSEMRRLRSRGGRTYSDAPSLVAPARIGKVSRNSLLLGTALGLVLAAYAAAPTPARAANECGPPPPGGGTVTCTPAGNTFPAGIDYDPVVVDLTVVLQPGVVVINNGTPAQPNGVEIGSSTAGVDLSLQGATSTSITTNAANHDGVDVVATDGTVTVAVDDVATTLAGSRGIIASGRGTTTVTADTVSTLGENSDGISAEEGNFLLPGDPAAPTGTSVTVNSVSTEGDNSTGIIAFSENSTVVVDSGTIATTGDYSTGLLAIAAVDDVRVTSDTITTSGHSSIGIDASIFPFPDEVVVGSIYVDSGSVETTGYGALGIRAESPMTDVTVISNSVSTTGDSARGISAFISGQAIAPGTYVYGEGDIVIQSNQITTTGTDYAGGIFAQGTDNVTITSNSVSTQGDRSTGIYARAYFDGNVVITSGSVTTAGGTFSGQSNGIHAIAENGSITIDSNTIGTTGDYSRGIDAFTDADVTIRSTTISTAGEHSFGINARSRYGGVEVVSNSVVAEGASSFGITAVAAPSAGIFDFDPSQSVYVTSNSVFATSQGIHVVAHQGNATIDSGTVEVSGGGAGSVGIFAFTVPGAITITSDQVITAGNGTNGIVADSFFGDILIDSGLVHTQGDDSGGILAVGRSISIVSDEVNTEGADSTGIDAFGGIYTSGETVVASRVVTTLGANSTGIDATSVYGSVRVTSDVLETTGQESDGIIAIALRDGDVTVDSGSVRTNGPESRGVFGDTLTGDVFITSDEVVTSGNYSQGVVAITSATNEGGTGLARIDSGSVFTSGTFSAGLSAYGGTAIIVSGSVTTEGDFDSDGIFARSFIGDATITSGSVVIGGDESYGINALARSDLGAYAAGNVTITSGTVTTSGANSTGIRGEALGDRNVTINSGAVTTTGPGSDGILALTETGDLVVILSGDVSAARGGIVLVDGVNNSVTTSGAITGSIGLTVNRGTTGLSFDGDITGTDGPALLINNATLNILGGVGNINGDVDVDGAFNVARSQNLDINGGITGIGSFTQAGAGVTSLNGTSTHTGGTFVTDGTLLVNGLHSGGADVATGGTIGGTGTISGNVTLADGATLSPGAGGPGTLGIGSLVLSPGSFLAYELGTPGVVGDGVNDLVNVGGNLTLDGILNITDAGGFGPGIYRIFNYGGTLTDNGLAIGSVPAGDAGDFEVQTAVANQVNLVTTAGQDVNFWDGGDPANRNDGEVDGGSGIWNNVEPNWTLQNGNVNTAMDPQPGFAIFTAEPGTVTVDDSAGPVGVTGMQFAVDGYRIEGDPIFLSQAESIFRVGDGTASGAGFLATIASELTGEGGLVKTDLGTLLLTAANTFTGQTVVRDGTLLVNGSLLSGVDVLDGGTLGGTGTVGGFIAGDGGTVAPGNSIGTLHVAGDLTFNSGSFYEVEIAADGSSDRIEATGTATLNGGTVAVELLDPDTSFAINQAFLILSAQGGVAGQFDGVSEDSAFLNFTLAYDPTQVILNTTQAADFTSVAETFNQRQTAGALEDFDTTPGSDSLLVLNSLLFLNEEEAREAFDLASGEIHASLQHTVLDIGELYANTLQRRAGVLAGSAALGFDVAPLGYTMGGTEGGLPPHALAVDAPAAMIDGPAADRRLYGVWAAVLGETGEIDGDGNAAELDYDIGGLAGGVDGTFDLPNASAMLGISAGYTTTDADVSDRQSSADISSVHLGLYGAWDNERLRLSAAAAYGFHDIETEREIAFDGIDRTAEADYDGHSFALSGEAAYRFGLGRMSVAPLATADLLWGSHDDAEESGADSLNLSIDSEDFSRVEAGIGIALGGRWAVGTSLVTAEARVLWEHAFGDDTPDQDLVLAGAPGTSFTVLGPEGSEDWLTVGTGLGIALSQGLTLSSHYQGAISGDGSSHQGHVSLGYRF